MTDLVAKKIAKHVLKESAVNKFGTEDPYFDYIPPVDAHGNPKGKKPKKQKKAVPPGLTKQEEKVLKKVTRRAYRLDNCFNVCGIRVGWEAIAGIIPGLGDVFGTLCALMVLHTCQAADIPASLKSRMLLNIMIDFAIGLVPILGDIADTLYRANTRNAALLYSHLKARGAARIAEDEKIAHRGAQGRERSRSRGRGGQQMRQIQEEPKPKRDNERKQLPPLSSSQQQRPQQQHSSGSCRDERNAERPAPALQQPPRRFLNADDLTVPEPARVRDGKNGRSGGGWFSNLLRGGGSDQAQERDVENLDRVPGR